ncbi:hypothetical protein BDK51DRAFT_51082 [Blyttiomyces helicus]|uniref:Uncharacterized protein n=1 Tax=Blyttiomyces helicus TaxID=388810 RepID=A0A4V1IS96_9FUNG|nr:hypothetical protein BDK51DRAFT_51082 [Blyttiomyces helicus]|eukprot:RKO92787.1 hypothetical protein BDK51DRAFT_51082 [Blyttiomyces helicus]
MDAFVTPAPSPHPHSRPAAAISISDLICHEDHNASQAAAFVPTLDPAPTQLVTPSATPIARPGYPTPPSTGPPSPTPPPCDLAALLCPDALLHPLDEREDSLPIAPFSRAIPTVSAPPPLFPARPTSTHFRARAPGSIRKRKSPPHKSISHNASADVRARERIFSLDVFSLFVADPATLLRDNAPVAAAVAAGDSPAEAAAKVAARRAALGGVGSAVGARHADRLPEDYSMPDRVWAFCCFIDWSLFFPSFSSSPQLNSSTRQPANSSKHNLSRLPLAMLLRALQAREAGPPRSGQDYYFGAQLTRSPRPTPGFPSPGNPRATTSDQSLISRLTLSQILDSHTGCVNALSWNASGTLLISGSDDLHLGLWSYRPGPSEPTRDGIQPPTRLLARIPTGHRANIFSAKFMPNRGDSVVVCCAGDSEIRVVNLHLGTDDAKATLSRVYRCHEDRAKRICTLEHDPNVFLSCSEDGTVRQFDLRVQYDCSSSRTCTHPALIDYSPNRMALHSISVNRLNQNLLAVAGTNPYIYLHDRRFPTKCVRKFYPPGLDPKNHITSIKFAESNGEELLGSWSNDYVYLFELNRSEEARRGAGVSKGARKRRAGGDAAPLPLDESSVAKVSSAASSSSLAGTWSLNCISAEEADATRVRAAAAFVRGDFDAAGGEMSRLLRNHSERAAVRGTDPKSRGADYRDRARCFLRSAAVAAATYEPRSVSESAAPATAAPFSATAPPSASAPLPTPESSSWKRKREDSLASLFESPSSLSQNLHNAVSDAARSIHFVRDDPRSHLLRAAASWGLASASADPTQQAERAVSALSRIERPVPTRFTDVEDAVEACRVGVAGCQAAPDMSARIEAWRKWSLRWIRALEAASAVEPDADSGRGGVDREAEDVEEEMTESEEEESDEEEELVEVAMDGREGEEELEDSSSEGESDEREELWADLIVGQSDDDDMDGPDGEDNDGEPSRPFPNAEISSPVRTFKGHCNVQVCFVYSA